MRESAGVLPSLVEGPSQRNVGATERLVSAAAGAALVGWGLARLVRGHPLQAIAGTAAGVAMASRGVTGRSAVYGVLGIEASDASRFSSPLSREVHVRHAVTINQPREELYHRWRNIGNLPNVMRHLIRVEEMEDGRSRWQARGPFGSRVTWEAMIRSDQPGRTIAWESLPGGQVETKGRITFRSRPKGRGTVVRVDLVYRPPAGVIGAAAAKIFGADPAAEIAADLRRFKQQVEAGEVATNAMNRSMAEQEEAAALGVDRESIEGLVKPRLDWRWSDSVEEASMESFPASDSPGWIGATGAERERS